MSARLIKKSENPGVAEFMPFMPLDTGTPRPSGTVTPFTPRSKGATFAQAQPLTGSADAVAGALPVSSLNNEAGAFPDASAEAERLIAEAHALANQIEQEARERGLAQGRAEAEAEVARLIEPLRHQLAQTIEETASLRAGIAESAERDLVKLAIEIAKKIVHRQVTVDNEVALTLARIALARIHSRAQAKIYLHPEDFAYVSKHLDRLATGRSIELAEDRAISRGGCLIETEIGDIDARIEQQFAELERSFLGV